MAKGKAQPIDGTAQPDLTKKRPKKKIEAWQKTCTGKIIATAKYESFFRRAFLAYTGPSAPVLVITL